MRTPLHYLVTTNRTYTLADNLFILVWHYGSLDLFLVDGVLQCAPRSLNICCLNFKTSLRILTTALGMM